MQIISGYSPMHIATYLQYMHITECSTEPRWGIAVTLLSFYDITLLARFATAKKSNTKLHIQEEESRSVTLI